MLETAQLPEASQDEVASVEGPTREETSYEGFSNSKIQPPSWKSGPELSNDETQVRIRTASVIRAARKAAGFNQQELASQLGITQGALSKIEAGLLLPSMIFWFALCKLVKIDPADAYATGIIDRCQSHTLKQGEVEGRFKIPSRYATDRGSSVRSMMPMILFFKEMYGEQSFLEYARSRKVDPDYFLILDNVLNVQFNLDLISFLLSKKVLRKRLLRRVLEPVAKPLAHGLLHRDYDSAANTRELLQTLMIHSSKYEVNFGYRLENEAQNRLEISIKPHEHMRAFEYHNEQLGSFLCDYRKEYLISFSRYGGRFPIGITETQCHYHGAEKCVYQLDLEPNESAPPEQ